MFAARAGAGGESVVESNAQFLMFQQERKVKRFEDVRKGISGFVRIIEYEKCGSELKIMSLIEGQVKEGKISGYARVFNIQEQKCSLGFWKPLQDY